MDKDYVSFLIGTLEEYQNKVLGGIGGDWCLNILLLPMLRPKIIFQVAIYQSVLWGTGEPDGVYKP